MTVTPMWRRPFRSACELGLHCILKKIKDPIFGGKADSINLSHMCDSQRKNWRSPLLSSVEKKARKRVSNAYATCAVSTLHCIWNLFGNKFGILIFEESSWTAKILWLGFQEAWSVSRTVLFLTVPEYFFICKTSCDVYVPRVYLTSDVYLLREQFQKLVSWCLRHLTKGFNLLFLILRTWTFL